MLGRANAPEFLEPWVTARGLQALLVRPFCRAGKLPCSSGSTAPCRWCRQDKPGRVPALTAAGSWVGPPGEAGAGGKVEKVNKESRYITLLFLQILCFPLKHVTFLY